MANKVIGRPFPKGVSGNPKGRPKDQRTLEQRKLAALERYRRDYPGVAARLLQLEMRMDILEGQVALTGAYADKLLDQMLRRDVDNGLLVVEPTDEQLANTMTDAELLARARAPNAPDEVKEQARAIAEREIRRRRQQA